MVHSVYLIRKSRVGKILIASGLGDFRVVYSIHEKEIRVLKIGPRKGIYKKLSASFLSCLFFDIYQSLIFQTFYS